MFSEVGYAAAGLGEVIERAGMTKGALYHHFDSKEALATAIIEQGTNLTRDAAFRNVCESPSPALEKMIHGVFVVADLLVFDKTARTAEQLTPYWPNSTAPPSKSGAAGWMRSRHKPESQAPKATSAMASIPTMSANQSSTPCSAPNCSPRQQTPTITSSATNPIPRTSPAGNRRRHVIGLFSGVSCSRVPTPPTGP